MVSVADLVTDLVADLVGPCCHCGDAVGEAGAAL
jgi:hypothetical protein